MTLKFEVKKINRNEIPGQIFHLDHPVIGTQGSAILELKGWAVGTANAIHQIQVRTKHAVKNYLLNVIRPDVDQELMKRAVSHLNPSMNGFQVFVDLENFCVENEDSATLEIQFLHRPNNSATKPALEVTILVSTQPLQDPVPIFVVGSERSGTTIVRDALVKVLNVPGFGEGHLLPILTAVDSSIDEYYSQFKKFVQPTQDLMINRIDKDLVIGNLQRGFRELISSIYSGRNYWIDKTPGNRMLKMIPVLQKLWPQALFIYLQRRGLECIASRLRKFPKIPFKIHCKQWSECVRTWEEYKAGIRHLEIDQHTLLNNPSVISTQLVDFLKFDREFTDLLERYFSEHFPQRTTINTKVPSIKTIGWNQEQQDIFKRICSEEMKMAQYSLGNRYKLQES